MTSVAERSKPLVTAIIPFCDTPARFFREAVESVLAQTLGDWELLLIDDGSPAEVAAVADEFARRLPDRVSVLAHEDRVNRGLSASRNLGAGHARGDYIAFLDADDVWLPRKLEEQAARLESNRRAGMLFGRTRYWHSWSGAAGDAARDFTPALGLPGDAVAEPPTLVPLFLAGRVAVPCSCSVMVRRTVLDRVGGFEESFTDWYEDQVFLVKVCLEVPVWASEVCWDSYRQHSDSISSRATAEDLARSRMRFLEWVGDYAAERGLADAKLQRALAREHWKLHHPGVARWRRLSRKLVARLRDLSDDGSPVS